MAVAGGVVKENGPLELCNIVVVSADRNGSTAFMDELPKSGSLNGDFEIVLSECFSQDAAKNQPPNWWDPTGYPPAKVIEYLNRGTGKSVLLKIQITWPNFDLSYLEIEATRKIFFHRNLFESTLSRCMAQTTGHWHSLRGEDTQPYPETRIDLDFFESRFLYRIEQYEKFIDPVLHWCNEIYHYETYKFAPQNILQTNPKKQASIVNYSELKNFALQNQRALSIEKKILDFIESKTRI